MAEDTDKIPFLKQLVDSDPQVRDSAFVSLQTYLTSGRPFTYLDLLKLWRGLYFSMYHTPLTHSQSLISSITSLTLSLPEALFLPFSRAFWTTIAEQHPMLDAHRIDKYLLLMRRFLGVQLEYLQRRDWDEELLQGFLRDVQDPKEGPLGEGGEGEIVGDGVRYHLLDVWVDEVSEALEEEHGRGELSQKLMGPVDKLAKVGRTKVVRKRAREVLGDERLVEMRGDDED